MKLTQTCSVACRLTMSTKAMCGAEWKRLIAVPMDDTKSVYFKQVRMCCDNTGTLPGGMDSLACFNLNRRILVREGFQVGFRMSQVASATGKLKCLKTNSRE